MDKTFNSLKGISAGRDVKKEKVSCLEKLVRLTEDLMKTPWNTGTINKIKNHTLVKGIDYDEHDIRDLVEYYTDNKHLYPKNYFLGLYMGLIMDKLTIRNRNNDKNTRVDIDGRGRKFNYLFEQANQVDELVIKNFCSDGIISKLGKNKGNVNTIAAIGIHANYIANECANIKNAIFIGNNSGEIFNHYDGELDLLIARDNKVDLLLQSNFEYKIKNLVLVDNHIGMVESSFSSSTKHNIVLCNNEFNKSIKSKSFSVIDKYILKTREDSKLQEIISLVRAIDPNKTEQMLGQVYKIKELFSQRGQR